MAEGAISQALYSRPRWWNKPCARRFIPKLVGARMLLPRPFSFTNVHRANFLPKPPGHAKSAWPRGRLRPSNCSQWSFLRFTSGISPYHCGQLNESRRSFQLNTSTFSAKRSCHSSKTLLPFLRNNSAFSAKQLSLFTKKRHRTEQGFSLCPARCLDVQTIVRCLLLADLAHRQVGCGSSHKD